MLTSLVKLFGSGALVVLVFCGVAPSRAEAAVFRDRSSFNAASQNLQTIDFESATKTEHDLVIDGLLLI